MKTRLVHHELHLWKCRLFSVHNECLIVSVVRDTILPYHILKRGDVGNCILDVPMAIIVSRHPSPVIDGECSDNTSKIERRHLVIKYVISN